MTKAQQSSVQLLMRLWRHLSHHRRWQFKLILLLMLLVSFAEVLSIGAVLPFLAILIDPTRIFLDPIAQPFIQASSVTEPNQLILPLTVIFGIAALVAGVMRLILLWASTRLSFAAGADISISIYRLTLHQPYSVHVARNSSEIIDGITNKTGNAISIIYMALNLIGSSVIMTSILVVLFMIDPIIAIASFGGFGLIYILVIRLTRKRLLSNSQTVARETTMVIKSLQEGLGGIRDVLIDGSQATFCQIYKAADESLRRAQGSSSFVSASPRSGVEALSMVLIAWLAYVLALQPDGLVKAIPILGALALGAQRLLPALQQAYGSWSAIKAGHVSLQDTLELLDQPIIDGEGRNTPSGMTFQQQVRLVDLSFRYGDQLPWVISNLNLNIYKGDRIGFIGSTGSGKSTLLDIIMGLLQPTSGKLEIDGQVVTSNNNSSWQSHIAHVPQTIYLADSTIQENIAFGVPKEKIDPHRVRQAAEEAQIAELIESWPDKYKTFVGERGVRLSGGQRQRIGIARALYKRADVIIFDEATSALDNETEQAVMKAIENLSKDLTLLIIAHRLTTLKNCNRIVELEDGGISHIGNYQEIVHQKIRVQQNGKGN